MIVWYYSGVFNHSKTICKYKYYKTYSCSNFSKIGHPKEMCTNRTEHDYNINLDGIDLNLTKLGN